MSKIGQEVRALMYDDFGEPSVFDKSAFCGDEADEIKEGWKLFELAHYSTEELQAELERRGYVNGVLVHPEKDED